MANYTHETIIITKEAWKFLRNLNRKIGGFRPVTDEMHEREWQYVTHNNNRNRGANPVSHPIADNEIRIHPGYFGSIAWDDVKEMLADDGFADGGFGYRQDGYVIKGMCI